MFWTLALIALAVFLFNELHWKRRKYPPGPTPIPLVGNVLGILWDFPGMSKYKEWKAKFGPIYTYWLGPWPIVTVNDYNLVQEMFVNDGEAYADRASFAAVADLYRGGSFGIADTNGQVWREQRRFALHTLRDFGLGKDEMQERILHEADDLLSQLEDDCKTGGSTKPMKYLEKTVASVINLTLFGFRFDKDHEEQFYRLNKLLKDQVQVLANPLLIIFFSVPKLVPYIPIVRGYFEKVFKVRDALYGYFNEHIETHKAAIDYSNDEVNDFCDAYLKEMNRRKDEPETSFHDKQLINVCIDLWFAGMDTTATTMGWGTLILMHHPEVLSKLHDEFDSVIGSDRLITTNDKSSLPYTNAFINEVQRWANILPQNLLRRLNKDVSIAGVNIPEGTSVTPQISMLLTDEETFPDPHIFNPDRFLDGGKLKTYKQFLPFSVGKRQCPGEGLARMELFLFFANLAHRFDIECVDPSTPPSLVKKMKNGGKPEEFECVLKRRTSCNLKNFRTGMFWTLALIALAVFLFNELHWKRRKYPPGPTPIPLLGNLLGILWNFPGMNKYKEWKAKFGSIYTYWLGPWPIVTVNDYNLVQEMFVNDGEAYADRKSFGAIADVYRGGSYGIADTNGQVWREQRRFALHTLRDFGLGKDEMQERILHEADDLLSQLEEDCKTGGSTKPIKYLEKTVASVINLTLFGFRFDKEHESEFYRLNKLMKEQMQVLANPLLLVFFNVPNLVPYIPIVRGYFEMVYKVRDELYAYFNQHIETHKAVIDYSNDEVNDFCDAYLTEMNRRKDEPETSFHDKQFVNVCLDLWFAGTDTTATTMAWGTMMLMHHPEVLAKLHDEFDRVIGSDRLITTNDKSSLPYTNAFINEVQRWANILPQNLLRRLNKDVSIAGVAIPEGATVTPQISMLLTDEAIFPSPDTFNPDRFIDGGKLKAYKQFLPFSAGKRQCPGEGLARMELFLFFANLAHRFDIECVDPSTPPSLVKKLKNGGKPEEFECVLKRRTVSRSS